MKKDLPCEPAPVYPLLKLCCLSIYAVLIGTQAYGQHHISVDHPYDFKPVFHYDMAYRCVLDEYTYSSFELPLDIRYFYNEDIKDHKIKSVQHSGNDWNYDKEGFLTSVLPTSTRRIPSWPGSHIYTYNSNRKIISIDLPGAGFGLQRGSIYHRTATVFLNETKQVDSILITDSIMNFYDHIAHSYSIRYFYDSANRLTKILKMSPERNTILAEYVYNEGYHQMSLRLDGIKQTYITRKIRRVFKAHRWISGSQVTVTRDGRYSQVYQVFSNRHATYYNYFIPAHYKDDKPIDNCSIFTKHSWFLNQTYTSAFSYDHNGLDYYREHIYFNKWRYVKLSKKRKKNISYRVPYAVYDLFKKDKNSTYTYY